jgi:hypothetical protein
LYLVGDVSQNQLGELLELHLDYYRNVLLDRKATRSSPACIHADI